MGLINIRSMRFKVDHVNEYLDEFGLALLCITETWLHDYELSVVRAALPGNFSVLHIPRSSNLRASGGGVALVYSTALRGMKLISNYGPFLTFECITAVFSLTGKSIKVAVVYRAGHPGTDSAFMIEFGEFLESFSIDDGVSFICGDFNYWMDDPGGKPFSAKFVELLEINNLKNLVTTPTHIAGHTLDLVFSSVQNLEHVCNLAVWPIDPSVTDHALITFEIDLPKPKTDLISITYRNYRGICTEDIKKHVNSFIGGLDFTASCEELVAHHNNFFTSLSNKFCPVVSKKINYRENAPWFDSSIRCLRRNRRKAERRWRRLRTQTSRNEYVAARQAVVNGVSEQKARFYEEKIDECGGNQQKLWRVLNNLLGRVPTNAYPDSLPIQLLAENFNSFFISKIQLLRDEIDGSNLNLIYSDVFQNFTSIQDQGFFHRFSQVSNDDVIQVIKSVKSTYCSLDPINVSKISESYESAVPLICAIINKSFVEGIFPSSEKRAVVRPLLKKSTLDRNVLNNYRPVSNLSFLSKVIERAILNQLLPFLDQNKILPSVQSAFRKFHSTETALCKVHDDIVKNVCAGFSSVLILLDLSAAFDTIDHNLLFQDLSNIGIADRALSLVKSYLSGRSQSVTIESSSSESAQLLYGVPQGSILGPILFLIYSSGLSHIMQAHGVDYHLYADDTQIYIPINSIEDSKNKLDQLLSDIRLWMNKRKLRLNEGKTEVILIRGSIRNNITNDFGVLYCGESEVMPSDFIRNIGVIFDQSLTFERHISNVVKDCHFHLRNLYSIRKYVGRNSLITLVHALISCRLDYCNSIFIGLPKKNLKKLQLVLNRAARLICSVHPRERITPSLISLHWLPVKARIEFKICLIVFKVLKYGQPQYLADLLVPQMRDSSVMLRSGDDPHRLYEPRAPMEHTFASRSFSFVAPRLYNALPVKIKSSTSVTSFKKQLKTLFFGRSYDFESGQIRPTYAL